MKILYLLSERLWYPWLLGLFLCTGLVYSLCTGFFQLFGVRRWLRATVGSLLRPRRGNAAGLSPVQALATALASTIGTGSIAGVAAALTLGGPGSIFWMWVSALLGMMTSWAEKTLAVRYQHPAPGGGLQGGPMYYLRDGAHAPLLAALFALACIPATLMGGSMIQSSSIASALHSAFGVPPLLSGMVTMVLAGLVLLGGVGRIARFSTLLVPAMALLYLGSGALVLLLRASEVPNALHLILTCALAPQAALGGGAGWTVACALRCGIARGVFTNEAGLGTSAIAHGAAAADSPSRQGMWGIFEVCVSTVLVCTVTALVILVSGVWPLDGSSPLSGAALTTAAFGQVLGSAGHAVVALSLLLFAFSSILGWSYYGQQALEYLLGTSAPHHGFQGLFLLCVLLGALKDSSTLWPLVDLCNALMALPNLVGLLLLAPRTIPLLEA